MVLLYCRKLLEITLILMGIFPTSILKQDGPQTTVIVRNVGIKLCQLKCIESGQCFSFEYDIETLTCRLSRDDSKKIKKKEGYTRIAKNCSDVFSGSCASKTCAVGQRCLKTRSGSALCVQDGEQTYTERPPQHDIAKQESFANSSLHDACKKGNVLRVRRILSRTLVDINSRDKRYGRTPLMVAAQKGHSKIVEILLRKAANVSHVDDNGDNVLYWACRGGHVGMVKLLLSNYSVDINRRGQFGRTPLMTTAYYGHRDVFDTLLSMGANVSQVDDGGDNVLHLACRGGHVGMVKLLLLNCSVDINSRGYLGRTPLIMTVYYGHREVFDTLLSMGANVSQEDHYGDNILHWACRKERVGMVRYLLSKNSVDINSSGRFGRTPLMTTACYGHIDIFKYLVSLGANASLVDDRGENILHCASIGGHADMIQHIISQDVVDINSRERYGRTPLMRATYYGKREAFELLVRNGCLTDLVDDNGETILHLACLGGRMKMVKYILSRKMADINAKDKGGNTAAMIAKRERQHALYDCLVSRACLVKSEE